MTLHRNTRTGGLAAVALLSLIVAGSACSSNDNGTPNQAGTGGSKASGGSGGQGTSSGGSSGSGGSTSSGSGGSTSGGSGGSAGTGGGSTGGSGGSAGSGGVSSAGSAGSSDASAGTAGTAGADLGDASPEGSATAGSSGAAGEAGTQVDTIEADTVDAAVADANPYLTPYCTPVAVDNPLVTDFTYTEGSATDNVSWGDYTNILSGYSFFYPSTITSDVTGNAWHLGGAVTDYAGAALAFACKADASQYAGISFTIRGKIGGPVPAGDAGTALRDAGVHDSGAATNVPISFSVGSARTDIASTTDPSWGTCIPKNNPYDGTCAAPSKSLTVTSTGTTYRIKWSDLTGGKPGPVDPSQLTGLRWVFPWSPSTGAYAIDITIDDVSFFSDAADAAVTDAAHADH